MGSSWVRARPARRLAVTAVLVLGACGSSGSSPTAGPASTPAATGPGSSASTRVPGTIAPTAPATSATTGGTESTSVVTDSTVGGPPPTMSLSATTYPGQTFPPPSSVPPRSYPLPAEPAAEYVTRGRLIGRTDGTAHVSYAANASFPPQVGFGVPVIGLDWAIVDGAQAWGDAVWTDDPHELRGTWDGTSLTLTAAPVRVDAEEPRVPPFDDPTPDCDLAATQPLMSEPWADSGLGIIAAFPWTWGGECALQVYALIDQPVVQQALAPYGDLVRVEYAIVPAA